MFTVLQQSIMRKYDMINEYIKRTMIIKFFNSETSAVDELPCKDIEQYQRMACNGIKIDNKTHLITQQTKQYKKQKISSPFIASAKPERKHKFFQFYEQVIFHM